MRVFSRSLSVCFCAAFLLEPALTIAQAPLVGLVRIPGTASDRSGLVETLETGTPHNALGGFSAIEYTGTKDRYWVLSDRGPADGASSFTCRFHEIDFAIAEGRGNTTFDLVATHLVRGADGKGYSGGLAPMAAWDGKGHPPSLDPEGIRRVDENRLAISDEYGPTIDLFDHQGHFLQSLPMSDSFRLMDRNNPPQSRGTFPNRGMEGLAVSKGGDVLIAAMQGPLVQDGRIENNKCLGQLTRWLIYDLRAKSSKEWVYPLDDESTGVSEVLAVDDHRFLVLERDSKAGMEAKIKKIYLADTTNASDVTQTASLRDGVPNDSRPIEKRLLIDLMHPEYGLTGDATPEKPEGLAWGPIQEDGSRILVVCFDNDFDPARESLIAAFRIERL